MLFNPLIFVVMVFFAVGLVVIFVVVQIGAISYAFEKIGIPSTYMFGLLMLSWFGSWVNIPVARLRTDEPLYDGVIVSFFGQRYVIPRRHRPRQTVLAVNLGAPWFPRCFLSIC